MLLAIVAFLAHREAEPVVRAKNRDLQTVFGPVAGYRIASRVPLEQDVYRFLDLDDYTSVNYEKEGVPVGLYIGYYFSLDKVSAAHSPLVCFPGQGWAIDQPVLHRLDLGGYVINYAEIIARLENRQELIMYWYQAGTSTSPEIYKNKMNAVFNKLGGKGQEHAFVRVSVPVADSAMERARETGKEFIAAFYPAFLAYIAEQNSSGRN